MSTSATRRTFLRNATATASLLGLSGMEFLSGIRPVSADEAEIDPNLVRFDSGIEPLVRLIEDTTREKLLEEVGARIKKGLGYSDLLTALFLAGLRNIRPIAGNNFHSVLVIHSAHLASLASPDRERWLPIFWSLDNFKKSQNVNIKAENGWRMKAVDESKVPPAHNARAAFVSAMDNWDAEAADAAIVSLARTAGAGELFELFARYGARDFSGLGHKAIFLGNGWRTLRCIGWQHAEPVLRGLTRVLLDNPPPKANAKPERTTDLQPWLHNHELAAQLPAEWQEGKASKEATTDMLAAMREGSDSVASQKAFDLLKNGISPKSVWDGIFVGMAELTMRQPARANNWFASVFSLHALTTVNALRYAYELSGNDETRRMLLLQSAAYVRCFRDNMQRRGGKVEDGRIDQLEPEPLKATGADAPAEIFAAIGADRGLAARKTLAYLKDNPRPQELIDAARLLIFMKGSDAHDYKYSAAVFEDYERVSPEWRNRYLANTMYILRGSADKDNSLVNRIRAALNA